MLQIRRDMIVFDTACTVHVVSLTPHAFLFIFTYQRCFVYDFNFLKLFEKIFVHAVSLTLHTPFLIFLHTNAVVHMILTF
jgi:hypothetical protein